MMNIYHLVFPEGNCAEENMEYRGNSLKIRAYRHLPYVSMPVDVDYQSLDLYEPVSFGEREFNTENAPIILLNRCGGYRAYRNSDEEESSGHRAPKQRRSSPRIGPAPGEEGGGALEAKECIAAMLAAGFVVAVPGNRGIGCRSDELGYYGKAPATIVDLKAAVRYLRHNAERIPGNTEYIISRGTSAGGAMSALLACSGNDEDYEPYLRAIGAAKERDDVFAGICISPVLDLEHQDCAYEWQYGKLNLNGFDNTISPPVDQRLSAALSAQYEEYLRSLSLNCRGGHVPLLPETYKEYYLNEFLFPSAEKWLKEQTEDICRIYLEERPWLQWDGEKVHFSFEDYEVYVGRLKSMPAFDCFELGHGENAVFGTDTEEAHHFTEFSLIHSEGAETAVPADIIVQRELMNPAFRLFEKKGKVSEHWWIRMGAKESGFACPLVVNVVSALYEGEKNVDFRLVWDGGHCAEDDLEKQISWISYITGYKA